MVFSFFWAGRRGGLKMDSDVMWINQSHIQKLSPEPIEATEL